MRHAVNTGLRVRATNSNSCGWSQEKKVVQSRKNGKNIEKSCKLLDFE